VPGEDCLLFTWDVMMCRCINTYRRFGEAYGLHHQGRRLNNANKKVHIWYKGGDRNRGCGRSSGTPWPFPKGQVIYFILCCNSTLITGVVHSSTLKMAAAVSICRLHDAICQTTVIFIVWGLGFSQRCYWRFEYSGMWRRVVQ